MSIIVNPHNQQEETKLLAFLDSMKYDYVQDNDNDILPAAQQAEILARDKEYEAGETKTYSIDEIVAYFNINEK
ncbi:MAG TPA: hypothetical protein VIQ77_02320 [Mucilaginibacter sp.]|jgi:hypothetical protein